VNTLKLQFSKASVRYLETQRYEVKSTNSAKQQVLAPAKYSGQSFGSGQELRKSHLTIEKFLMPFLPNAKRQGGFHTLLRQAGNKKGTEVPLSLLCEAQAFLA
jgi:hypothetical protein